MNRRPIAQAGLMSLTLLASAILSLSQTHPNGAAQNDRQNINANIIYTGKLLGYFRVPSLQSSAINRCPVSPQTGDRGASEPARQFLQLRSDSGKGVLVGTGDNFAPQLEARVFEPAPTAADAGKYSHGNKELFYWDRNQWVPYDKGDDSLYKRLANGLGTIPNDNVGCFLAAAKYAAVVPGKHDFYFGADRVRQFARFMAGIRSSREYEPVQMLGANLVLSTAPIKDQPLLPREIETPWFKKIDWPKDYPVLNVRDGDSIYPWFSYVKIKLAGLNPNQQRIEALRNWLRSQGGLVSEAALTKVLGEQKDQYFVDLLSSLTKAIDGFNISLHRCPSKDDPNAVADPRQAGACSPLPEDEKLIGLVGNTLAYFFPFPRNTRGRITTSRR